MLLVRIRFVVVAVALFTAVGVLAQDSPFGPAGPAPMMIALF